MDNRGALRLDADANARPGIFSRIMGDKGNVGGAVYPYHAPFQPFFLNAGNNLTQHLVVGLVDNGFCLVNAESRSQADHNLVWRYALWRIALLC